MQIIILHQRMEIVDIYNNGIQQRVATRLLMPYAKETTPPKKKNLLLDIIQTEKSDK